MTNAEWLLKHEQFADFLTDIRSANNANVVDLQKYGFRFNYLEVVKRKEKFNENFIRQVSEWLMNPRQPKYYVSYGEVMDILGEPIIVKSKDSETAKILTERIEKIKALEKKEIE